MADPNAILAKAMADHQAGRLDAAAIGYRRILRKHPKHPDALHFFGLLHFHRGQGVEAVALIMQSLAQAPGNPHAWNNLGNILSAQDKMAEAKEAYRRVTVLAPKMAEVWYNLAICLRDEGEFDQAAAHFRKAIEHQPDFMRAYEYLGMLLYRVGDYAQAAEVYRAWLCRDPQSPVARHMAAATSGTDIPERANDQYVAKIFDRFAASFDNNLKNLGYRAPELVATALTAHVPAQATLDILDAGCGTGLCGPLLRPMCRRLTGVDLSPKMLDHARERGGYEELCEGELCAFMRSRAAQFDAVVSADTLVYFGALEEACAAARHSLRPSGLLVFTVEASAAEAPEPYMLQVHGRYTHRESYVREVLSHTGFEVLSAGRETLRMEKLQDVIGHLVVARVPRASDPLSLPGRGPG